MKARASKRPSWDFALDVLKRHRARLLRRSGVVGLDLGIKRRAGALLAGPAIRVHVSEKAGPDKLNPRQCLPDAIEGVPVDVVESSFRVRLACPGSTGTHRLSVRPLVAGCSIGHFGEDKFGTLGPVVTAPDGTRGALTCAHVCSTGDIVRQPHKVGNRIGQVIADRSTNELDAAFIEFDPDCPSKAAAMKIGPLSNSISVPRPKDLPFAVDLIGACSGRTRGVVIALEFEGTVNYPDGDRRVSRQLCIESSEDGVFARSGDSGSVVVDGQRPVGVLIAADEGGRGLPPPSIGSSRR